MIRERYLALDGTEVDQGAVALGTEHPECGVAGVDHTFEIDIDHPCMVRDGHLPERPDCADAGEVDPGIDPSIARDGGVRETLNVLGLADIHGHDQRRPTSGAGLRRDLFKQARPARGQHDIAAMGRKLDRDALPESAGGAYEYVGPVRYRRHIIGAQIAPGRTA